MDLREIEAVLVPGPLLADILESMQCDLWLECPVCAEHGFVCGKCYVRASCIRRLLDLSDNHS